MPRTAFTVEVTVTDDDQTNSAIVLSWCDGGSGSVTEGGIASIPICADRPAVEDYTIKFTDQFSGGGTSPTGLEVARYDYQLLSDDVTVDTAVMRAGQTRAEFPICTKETPAVEAFYVDNCEVYDPDDGTLQIGSFENIVADGFTGQIEESERVRIRVESVEGIAANEIDTDQVDADSHYTLTIIDDDHFKQALELYVSDVRNGGTYRADELEAVDAGAGVGEFKRFDTDGHLTLRWTIRWVNAEGTSWSSFGLPSGDSCFVPWITAVAEIEVVEDLANLMSQEAVNASPGRIIESFSCGHVTSFNGQYTIGIRYDEIPPGVHKLVVRIKPRAYPKFGAHRNHQTYTLYIDGGGQTPRANPVSFRFSEGIAAEGGSSLLVIDRPVTPENRRTSKTVHFEVTESRQELYRFSNQHNSGVHADTLRDWGATSCEDSSVACENGKLRSVSFGPGEAQKKILFITHWNNTYQGSPGTITVRTVNTRQVPVLDSNGDPTGDTTTERIPGQHDPELTGPKTASFQVRDGEQYLRSESDLTGRFSGAPTGHQGVGSSFTMQLRFSPSLKHGVTYRQFTTEVPLTGGFQTSGRIVFGDNAIIPKARRIRGAFSSQEDRRYYLNREWELTVNPTHDYEPLTVVVPGVGICNKATAKDGYLHPYGVQHEEGKVPTILPKGAVVAQICTPHHGKPLRQNIEVTIPSRVPVVSMEGLTDGVLEVNEGTTSNVRFRLSHSATVPIIFNYVTAALTAQAGVDFTAITNGTVTFNPGQTRKTVQLEVLDNSVDNSGRLLYIRTSNGSTDLAANAGFKTVSLHPTTYAPGDTVYSKRTADFPVRIINTDPLPKAYLSGMGREVSRHVVDSMKNRMQTVKRGDTTQMSPRGEDALPTFTVIRDGMGFWSSASNRHFEVAEVRGSVDSYTVATDMQHGDWLFGLGVTLSEGEGKYESVTLKSDLTTAHPYVAWMNRDWAAWATVGQGSGTLDMDDAKTNRTYSDIDLTYSLVAAGVDRAHNWEAVRINVGANGFWNKTESERTVMPAGYHVGAARADNMSLSGYMDWTFNPKGMIQPTAGIAMVHDRDDYERSTNLRANAGVRMQREPFSGHVSVVRVLDNGERWDISGNLMFAPKRGFYGGLTTSVAQSNMLETEQVHASLQLETGWKRTGMSPYMTLGSDAWRIGQKLAVASHEIDMYLHNAQDEAQVRVLLKIRW